MVYNLILGKEYDALWMTIKNRSTDDIVQSTGISYNNILNKFVFEFMKQKIYVDMLNKTISSTDDTKIEYELGVVIVTYLTLAKNLVLSDDWITVNQIPAGNMFFQGVHTLPVEKIIEYFGSDSQFLGSTCQRLGGKMVFTTADTGYQFKLLPKVPIQMLYWFKDYEFPARVSILFDRTVDQFLLLDGILALVNVFIKRLQQVPPVK